MNRGFVAIDWGSSNFRAYRIDHHGEVVDQMSSTNGVAKVCREEMPAVLDDVVAKWPAEANAMFCCGMIGSTIGWADVPYIECPISPPQLAEVLPVMEIGANKINVSPGLSCQSIYGQPDVMRGEEMQYLGYLYSQPDYTSVNGMLCMPGTHSKWLAVEDGVATHFSTAMTGDIFAAMAQNGLLKTHLGEKVSFSPAFLEGVEYASTGSGLARHLFSVRSRVVTDDLANADAASYASGILIGSEICDALSAYKKRLNDGPIVLVGSADLCKLYQQTLAHFDYQSTIIDARDACINGFKLIHQIKEGAE